MASTEKTNGIVNIDTIDHTQKGKYWCTLSSKVMLMSDLDELPKDLRDALDQLEEQFTVDTKKLKTICERFQEELEEGESAILT